VTLNILCLIWLNNIRSNNTESTTLHYKIGRVNETYDRFPGFQIKRPSLANSSNDYSPTEGDEVEDLFDLLKDVRDQSFKTL
jgi:hypothetical protein